MSEILDIGSREPTTYVVYVPDSETGIDRPPQDVAIGHVAANEGVEHNQLNTVYMEEFKDGRKVELEQNWE